MTTLVTADDKGRISVRGSEPGRKYLVTQEGGEWRVTPYRAEDRPSRNRREWSGNGSLFDQLKSMAKAGLRIERSKVAKRPVPPCRF